MKKANSTSFRSTIISPVRYFSKSPKGYSTILDYSQSIPVKSELTMDFYGGMGNIVGRHLEKDLTASGKLLLKSAWKADTETHQIYALSGSKMQLLQSMCKSSHCRDEEWFVFCDWFSWFLIRQLARKWLCATQNLLFYLVLAVRFRYI